MIFTKEVPKDNGMYWYCDTWNNISICELIDMDDQPLRHIKGGKRVIFMGWEIPEPLNNCTDMLWGDKLEIPLKELKDA